MVLLQFSHFFLMLAKMVLYERGKDISRIIQTLIDGTKKLVRIMVHI